MNGWPLGEPRGRRKYSTLLYPSENDFSICRNGARAIFGIYAYGKFGSAGKAAQIGLRVVIKEERLFVRPFVAHLSVAVFIVNHNDGTFHGRFAPFRFGDNRHYNRPIAASDSSDEIHDRPEGTHDK